MNQVEIEERAKKYSEIVRHLKNAIELAEGIGESTDKLNVELIKYTAQDIKYNLWFDKNVDFVDI